MSAAPLQHPLRDLVGRALPKLDRHLREKRAEPGDGVGKGVGGLVVRRGDDQPAHVAVGGLAGDLADVLHLHHHPLDVADDVMARLGDADQALGLAHEDVEAELGLQVLDLLADRRLRGQQRGGRLGQVEVVLDGRLHGSGIAEGSSTGFAIAPRDCPELANS
ncbi:MAG: hypothetical protein WDM92_01030 [Caulobacteraceae bacterium]